MAVDPEMLGKLFEETVNERHDNGAYYTPRPVVSFMCREALKGYMSSKDIAGLDQDRIAKLVDGRDPKAVTTPQALEIANAVVEMKTVDPACGSGAFLLGMLQEIITLNDTLFRAGMSRASTKHTSGAEQKCTTREVIGQRKCPRQLFGRSVTEAGWQQAGRVSE